MSREKSSKRKEHGRGSLAGEEKGVDDVGSNICLVVTGRLFVGPVSSGPRTDADVALTQGAIFPNSSHHRGARDNVHSFPRCTSIFCLKMARYRTLRTNPPLENVC